MLKAAQRHVVRFLRQELAERGYELSADELAKMESFIEALDDAGNGDLLERVFADSKLPENRHPMKEPVLKKNVDSTNWRSQYLTKSDRRQRSHE